MPKWTTSLLRWLGQPQPGDRLAVLDHPATDAELSALITEAEQLIEQALAQRCTTCRHLAPGDDHSTGRACARIASVWAPRADQEEAVTMATDNYSESRLVVLRPERFCCVLWEPKP